MYKYSTCVVRKLEDLREKHAYASLWATEGGGMKRTVSFAGPFITKNT